MRELVFAEPMEIMIESLGEVVRIKPYLLVDEISEIVNTCKDEDPIARDVFMVAMIIDKCTNLQGFVEIDSENRISVDMDKYNLYKINNVISEIMAYIDERYTNEIEYYIGQYNGVNQTVKDLSGVVRTLLETANTALQGVSSGGFSIGNILEQLKALK